MCLQIQAQNCCNRPMIMSPLCPIELSPTIVVSPGGHDATGGSRDDGTRGEAALYRPASARTPAAATPGRGAVVVFGTPDQAAGTSGASSGPPWDHPPAAGTAAEPPTSRGTAGTGAAPWAVDAAG